MQAASGVSHKSGIETLYQQNFSAHQKSVRKNTYSITPIAEFTQHLKPAKHPNSGGYGPINNKLTFHLLTQQIYGGMSLPPTKLGDAAPKLSQVVCMQPESPPQVSPVHGSMRLSRSSWTKDRVLEETAPAVKETHHINIDYNPVSGRKKLNKYEIYRELGRGQHGKVKLGRDEESGQFVAIKTVDRKERPRLGRPQGTSTEEKIRREIAILKKCRHPNIVSLLEVLDDESSRKIYLVLEYLEKGEIKWQNADGSPAMTPDQARQVARDTLLGLEYLHANGVIHRDIKPANLLVSKDDVVKISDFGVSYAANGDFADTDLELAKTVGTPAFFAPEMCVVDEAGGRRHISAKIDIWAYGVTLFCILYGFLPFEADNEYELLRVVATEPLVLPDPKGDHDLVLANDLLARLLDKNPETRISIPEIKEHPWLANGMSQQQMKKFLEHEDEAPIQVSDAEVSQAVRGIRGRIKNGLTKWASSLKHSGRNSEPSPSSAKEVPVQAGTNTVPTRRELIGVSPAGSVVSTCGKSIQSASPTRVENGSLSGDAAISTASSASESCIRPLELQKDTFAPLEMWESSSSSDEDTGELTLVLGRKRTVSSPAEQSKSVEG